MGEWQPIETAPKTTQSRLVWCPDRKNIYAVTWCDDGYWMHWGGSTNELTEEPTHWMPLPAPPLPSVETWRERD